MEMEEIEDENRVCEKNSDPTSFSPRDTGRFLNISLNRMRIDTNRKTWYPTLTRFDPSGDIFIPLVD